MQLNRQIAVVRDASEAPARRAFAAAAVACGDPPVAATATDPATRLFDFDTLHADALPWDGRSTRSGTITYLDDERVEQYVGAQTWIAYRRTDLVNFGAGVGDRLRITLRGSDVAIETIGPNRLEGGGPAAREVRSGMIVLRVTAITDEELESAMRAVAERGSAVATRDAAGVYLTFTQAARIDVSALPCEAYAGFGESSLMNEPVAGALRLAVTVCSDKLEAALDAERALVLLAALLAAEAESIALDDTGALFCAEQLYLLATRNEMRADSFAFAAAAAQRQWPAPQAWLSGRQGVCDELIVFSSRPWCADFAATFLTRELDGFADAARATGDSCVPQAGHIFASDERTEPGSLERLAELSLETVDVDVAFLDLGCVHEHLRPLIDARKDIDVMLGQPAASAIVIAYGNRESDTESELFGLEMRRAEVLATALGAAFAARGNAVATDVGGTLYSSDDLQQLARRRCGKSSSWNARAASFCKTDVHEITLSDRR